MKNDSECEAYGQTLADYLRMWAAPRELSVNVIRLFANEDCQPVMPILNALVLLLQIRDFRRAEQWWWSYVPRRC